MVCKYVTKKEEERVFAVKMFKSEEVNDWKTYTFKLVTALSRVPILTRSILELTSIKIPYYLGQIKLLNGKKADSPPIKCLLENSRDRQPASNYYLHLTISAKHYHRLYVLIQQFGLFAYFVDGVARLRNIPISKCESLEVQVVDTDGGL